MGQFFIRLQSCQKKKRDASPGSRPTGCLCKRLQNVVARYREDVAWLAGRGAPIQPRYPMIGLLVLWTFSTFISSQPGHARPSCQQGPDLTDARRGLLVKTGDAVRERQILPKHVRVHRLRSVVSATGSKTSGDATTRTSTTFYPNGPPWTTCSGISRGGV